MPAIDLPASSQLAAVVANAAIIPVPVALISDAQLAPPVPVPVVPVPDQVWQGRKEVRELLHSREVIMNERAMEMLQLERIQKKMDSAGVDPSPELVRKKDQCQQAVDQLNQQLNTLLADPRMLILQANEASHFHKDHNSSTLKNAGLAGSVASVGISATEMGLKQLSVVAPALTTASKVASSLASAVAPPLSAAQTLISAGLTTNAVRDLWKDSGHMQEARKQRHELKEDPELEAVMKRVQTKHGRNCIKHGFDVASNSIDTIGGGITTVGYTATATLGVAAGAATMGGATAALATATTVVSLSSTAASSAMMVGSYAYEAGRSISSQSKKAEVNDAASAIDKLREAGFDKVNPMTELLQSSERTTAVGQKLINLPLVGSGIQALAGNRSGGAFYEKADATALQPAPQNQEKRTSLIDSLKAAEATAYKPSVRDHLGGAAKSVSTAVHKVTDPISQAAETVSGAAKSLSDRLTRPIVDSAAGRLVSQMGHSVSKGAQKVADGAEQALHDASEGIKSVASRATQAIENRAIDVKDTLSATRLGTGVSNVRESLGKAAQSAQKTVGDTKDRIFGIDQDKIHVTQQELKALNEMQNHAVKHSLRDLKPRIEKTAHEYASEEVKGKTYSSDKDREKAEKTIYKAKLKELTEGCKVELAEKFQDLDLLKKHVEVTLIARDSMTAVKVLADRMRTECAEALAARGGTAILAEDLPKDTPAVKMARKLDISDEQIARVVTAVSHENTQQVGLNHLAKGMKLR